MAKKKMGGKGKPGLHVKGDVKNKDFAQGGKTKSGKRL